MVRTIDDPEMPFVHYMDTDWIQKITIKGRAPAGSSRFSIFLQCGSESEPYEIPFVFDVRFNYGDDQCKIVTNHKKEGNWGDEEGRDLHFPFEEDRDFKIKVKVDDDSFKVTVDGEKLVDYEQKLDSKTINCIRIDNECVLYKVKMA